MRAEKVIKALLEASAGVTALVGTRMYSVVRPEGDALPALVWNMVSDVPQRWLSQDSLEYMVARIEVTAIGSTPEVVKSLLDQVRISCHNKRGMYASVNAVGVFQDSAGPDSYDPLVELYSQSIDFLVHYTR